MSAIVGIEVRTIGRGSKVYTFSGQGRAEVEQAAREQWARTDKWRRPAAPPLANLVDGLWCTAFIEDDCE